MKKFILMLGCFVLGFSLYADVPVSSEAAVSKRPIILVHGLAGVERKEGDSSFYWGGPMDLQEELIQKGGFDVRTAFVGPFSSNWDRACELYAYIKGGTVDYGGAHALEHNHARYGRTYPGLYPEWGELDENAQVRAIHIISHSQGGQTARMLAHLLKYGDVREQAYNGENGISPLFTGDKSWVVGIMTISTPHNGTFLSSPISASDQLLRFVMMLPVLFGRNGNFFIWDNHLDQWGDVFNGGVDNLQLLDKKFIEVVKNDNAFYDLSPEGAANLNRFVKTDPDVYYFSWATVKSRADMLIQSNYMYLTTLYLSTLPYEDTPFSLLSSEWSRNDGIVNSASMRGPSLGLMHPIVFWDGVPHRGVWNYMGDLEGVDHGDIVGITLRRKYKVLGKTLYEWYVQQCELLSSLP